jgi:hypothetical protein
VAASGLAGEVLLKRREELFKEQSGGRSGRRTQNLAKTPAAAAVVVMSKQECGIARGGSAHLQLASRFSGSHRQTCAVSAE